MKHTFTTFNQWKADRMHDFKIPIGGHNVDCLPFCRRVSTMITAERYLPGFREYADGIAEYLARQISRKVTGAEYLVILDWVRPWYMSECNLFAAANGPAV